MISTKGRYALSLMIDIATQNAEQEGVTVPLRAISERQGISLKYLEQLVVPLVNAGLLKSARGPHGGYRLARPATEISAKEVLRVSEDGLTTVACLKDDSAVCPKLGACKTHAFWEGLDSAMDTYMDSVTLADLAN